MSDVLPIPVAALDAILPMHLRVSATGCVVHAGPTVARLRPHTGWQGRPFLEVLRLLRPNAAPTMAGLLGLAGQRLHLQFRAPPETKLRGVVHPLPDGGCLVTLALGYCVVEAVRDYGLTERDFAHCDPTVEMLFLIEAKSAALMESKNVNARLSAAQAAAQQQAETDVLTGLHNRRAMDQRLTQMTDERRGSSFGLMHLDLDYFKQVNDTYGHGAGDHVLLVVADILREETRTGDLVARVGGDEFVLIFPDCTDVALLDLIAARIIARLEVPIPYGDVECRVSASIGTTVSTLYPRPDPDRMLSDADTALYASKNRGRACHTLFGTSLSHGAGIGL
jgi:diguanylate cyclase (GGDEF)-like protein